MIMANDAIVRFLRFLGVKLSPEDVSEINGDSAPKEKPPEMDAPVMNKALKANAFPAPGGGEAALVGAAQPVPEVPAQPSNLPLLDKLITDLGGFEAFKALLLKVAELDKPAEAPPPAPAPAPVAQNRALLVGQVLANSKGAMTGEDLRGMDVSMLKKVLELLHVDQAPVNYGALAVKTNKAEALVLERPKFFFAEAKQA